MSFLPRTLVLIPALNEAGCIGETVHRWLALGAGWVRVVDNGSHDQTAQVAREAGAEVLEEPRRGYGAACWTGLHKLPMHADWVLFSSADGSDRLEAREVKHWEDLLETGCEFILGDRFSLPQAREHLKWIQRAGNRVCCWMIYLGWARNFHDLGSLRLIRTTTLHALNLQDRGFGWNIEMQVRAVEQGVPMAEIPVHYWPREAGSSKISGSFIGTCRAAWGMMKMIARLWWRKDHRSHHAS